MKELPTSVTHNILEENRHQFTIIGLYPIKEDKNPEDFEFYCSGFFVTEAEVETEFSTTDLSLTITSKLPISYDWLAWATQMIGGATGILPTWHELKARDLPISKNFRKDSYVFEEFHEELPSNLAWNRIWREDEIRFPFTIVIAGFSQGTLILGPTRAEAPAPPLYSVRIIDEKGEIIWKQDEAVKGFLRVAVGDRDADNVHELYVIAADYTGKFETHHVLRFQSGGLRPANTQPLKIEE